MNYDHPKQPIDSSFAPLQDTHWEARLRQYYMDMQRGIITLSTSSIANAVEDACYPERKAQRIQAEWERRRTQAREEAKSLSDRELLESVYIMLKTR